jgi:hypothetical protein
VVSLETALGLDHEAADGLIARSETFVFPQRVAADQYHPMVGTTSGFYHGLEYPSSFCCFGVTRLIHNYSIYPSFMYVRSSSLFGLYTPRS